MGYLIQGLLKIYMLHLQNYDNLFSFVIPSENSIRMVKQDDICAIYLWSFELQTLFLRNKVSITIPTDVKLTDLQWPGYVLTPFVNIDTMLATCLASQFFLKNYQISTIIALQYFPKIFKITWIHPDYILSSLNLIDYFNELFDH